MEEVTVPVRAAAGGEAGDMRIPADVFDREVNRDTVHRTVRWQLVRRRAGTHSTLTRTVMKGGSKKPFKQKGTGRARAGSTISPHWVGGAVVHGPHPRDYGHKLPKGVRRAALKSVLSDKRRHDKLVVADTLDVPSGKTKDFVALLGRLGLEGRSVLVIPSAPSDALARACRNVPGAVALPADAVNVYDLLRHEVALFSREAVQRLAERLSPAAGVDDGAHGTEA